LCIDPSTTSAEVLKSGILIVYADLENSTNKIDIGRLKKIADALNINIK
jgi:hypothetical protein